jgi:predicted nucleic-acid-binding protein
MIVFSACTPVKQHIAKKKSLEESQFDSFNNIEKYRTELGVIIEKYYPYNVPTAILVDTVFDSKDHAPYIREAINEIVAYIDNNKIYTIDYKPHIQSKLYDTNLNGEYSGSAINSNDKQIAIRGNIKFSRNIKVDSEKNGLTVALKAFNMLFSDTNKKYASDLSLTTRATDFKTGKTLYASTFSSAAEIEATAKARDFRFSLFDTSESGTKALKGSNSIEASSQEVEKYAIKAMAQHDFLKILTRTFKIPLWRIFPFLDEDKTMISILRGEFQELQYTFKIQNIKKYLNRYNTGIFLKEKSGLITSDFRLSIKKVDSTYNLGIYKMLFNKDGIILDNLDDVFIKLFLNIPLVNNTKSQNFNYCINSSLEVFDIDQRKYIKLPVGTCLNIVSQRSDGEVFLANINGRKAQVFLSSTYSTKLNIPTPTWKYVGSLQELRKLSKNLFKDYSYRTYIANTTCFRRSNKDRAVSLKQKKCALNKGKHVKVLREYVKDGFATVEYVNKYGKKEKATVLLASVNKKHLLRDIKKRYMVRLYRAHKNSYKHKNSYYNINNDQLLFSY